MEELARPPLIVPETKDLGPLLREMREQREQLAVVVDEYGGVAGIVTREDLLEELVGEIEDEFDLPEARLHWLDDRTVCAAGSMSIDDLHEAVGAQLSQRGARTLAGLVFRRARPPRAARRRGRPRRRAGAVAQVEGLRITEVRIALPERAQPPSEAA